MSDFMYSPSEQKRIHEAVDEAVKSLMKQKGVEAAEKEHRKDIYESLKEDDVPIDKKHFNWLVNERFDGKSTELIEQHEDIVQLDEMLRNNNQD